MSEALASGTDEAVVSPILDIAESAKSMDELLGKGSNGFFIQGKTVSFADFENFVNEAQKHPCSENRFLVDAQKSHAQMMADAAAKEITESIEAPNAMKMGVYKVGHHVHEAIWKILSIIGLNKYTVLIMDENAHKKRVGEKAEEVGNLSSAEALDRGKEAALSGDGALIEACVNVLCKNGDDGIDAWSLTMYALYSGRVSDFTLKNAINAADHGWRDFHGIFNTYSEFDELVSKKTISKDTLKSIFTDLPSAMKFLSRWANGNASIPTNETISYRDSFNKEKTVYREIHIRDMKSTYVDITKRFDSSYDAENYDSFLAWMPTEKMKSVVMARGTDGNLAMKNTNKLFRGLRGPVLALAAFDLRRQKIIEELLQEYASEKNHLSEAEFLNKIEIEANNRMSVFFGGERSAADIRNEIDTMVRIWLEGVKPSELQTICTEADTLMAGSDLSEPPGQFFVREYHELAALGITQNIPNAFRLYITKFGLERSIKIEQSAAKASGNAEVNLLRQTMQSWLSNKFRSFPIIPINETDEEEKAEKIDSLNNLQDIYGQIKDLSNYGMYLAIPKIQITEIEGKDPNNAVVVSNIKGKIQSIIKYAPAEKGKESSHLDITKKELIQVLSQNKQLLSLFSLDEISAIKDENKRLFEKEKELSSAMSAEGTDIYKTKLYSLTYQLAQLDQYGIWKRTSDTYISKDTIAKDLNEFAKNISGLQKSNKTDDITEEMIERAQKNLIQHYPEFCCENASHLNEKQFELFQKRYLEEFPSTTHSGAMTKSILSHDAITPYETKYLKAIRHRSHIQIPSKDTKWKHFVYFETAILDDYLSQLKDKQINSHYKEIFQYLVEPQKQHIGKNIDIKKAEHLYESDSVTHKNWRSYYKPKVIKDLIAKNLFYLRDEEHKMLKVLPILTIAELIKSYYDASPQEINKITENKIAWNDLSEEKKSEFLMLAETNGDLVLNLITRGYLSIVTLNEQQINLLIKNIPESKLQELLHHNYEIVSKANKENIQSIFRVYPQVLLRKSDANTIISRLKYMNPTILKDALGLTNNFDQNEQEKNVKEIHAKNPKCLEMVLKYWNDSPEEDKSLIQKLFYTCGKDIIIHDADSKEDIPIRDIIQTLDPISEEFLNSNPEYQAIIQSLSQVTTDLSPTEYQELESLVSITNGKALCTILENSPNFYTHITSNQSKDLLQHIDKNLVDPQGNNVIESLLAKVPKDLKTLLSLSFSQLSIVLNSLPPRDLNTLNAQILSEKVWIGTNAMNNSKSRDNLSFVLKKIQDEGITIDDNIAENIMLFLNSEENTKNYIDTQSSQNLIRRNPYAIKVDKNELQALLKEAKNNKKSDIVNKFIEYNEHRDRYILIQDIIHTIDATQITTIITDVRNQMRTFIGP